MRQLKIFLFLVLLPTATLGEEETKARVREAWTARAGFWSQCEVSWSIRIPVERDVFSEYSFRLLLNEDKLRLEENGINRAAPVLPGAITNVQLRKVMTDDGVRSRDVTYPETPTPVIWPGKKSDETSVSVLRSMHRNQRVAALMLTLRPLTGRFHGFKIDRATCATEADGRVVLVDIESSQRVILDPTHYRVVVWEAPHDQPRVRTEFTYKTNDAGPGVLPGTWKISALTQIMLLSLLKLAKSKRST